MAEWNGGSSPGGQVGGSRGGQGGYGIGSPSRAHHILIVASTIILERHVGI